MTDCNNPDILDALPDLINGRLSPLDRATLTEHIAGCAACAADVQLLREIRLSAPLTPHVDVERIVAALPRPSLEQSLMSNAVDDVTRHAARLKPASVTSQRRQLVWGIMASVAVIAAAGLSVVMGRGGSEGDPVPARIVAQAPAVNDASGIEGSPSEASPGSSSGSSVVAGTLPVAAASESREVSQANAASAGSAALTLISGVNELSDADLELLLSEMDEMEGFPAQEPDPVTLELGNLEGDA